MIGKELIAVTGAIVGKELVKKAVSALVTACSSQVSKSLKSFQNEKNISKFYQQLGKVRKVKTLGQLDKAVDLTTFYCDSHVYLKKKRIKVREINDLPIRGNILIEGIAGQGKSIFLRYLTSVEAIKGNVVPIFAELRRIKADQDLTSFLIDTLKFYNLNVDESAMKEMIDSGRLIFLLDAFDEVPDHSKSRLLNDIELFTASHENARLIITSRPESGIAACTSFECVKLSNLEREEYIDVIHTITEDAELAEGLIRQIKEHKGQIRGLLITPLLVTLLVIRYKSFQELPAQLSDFYDSLFQLLLQRHDGLKPGYRRSRRCRMNDFQYRQVFESFCFNSKKFGGRPLNREDVYKASEESLNERKIQDNPEAFVDDIVKVTCLVVKDGEEFRFIHKSVQEYYTAAYIHQRPESVSAILYQKLFNRKFLWEFQQEIRFLKEIDTYKYQKYGIIPFLREVLNLSSTRLPSKPSTEIIKSIEEAICDCEVSYCYDENSLSGAGIRSFRLPYFGPFTQEILSILDKYLIISLFANLKEKRLLEEELKTVSFKTFLQIANSPELNRSLNKCAKEIAQIFITALLAAQKIVDDEEQFDPLRDFNDSINFYE